MRKKVFASIVFLVTMLFAVVGWATDWYVRPAGGSYGNEDGTNYENAWDGFSNIVWGTDGVQAGDTLWICGAFTGEQLLINNVHGIEGSNISIRFDYQSDNGSISSYSSSNNISIQNSSFITLVSPISSDSGASGMIIRDGSHDIFINGLMSYNNTEDGIQVYEDAGNNIIINNSSCYNNAEDGFDLKGGSNVSVTNCCSYGNSICGFYIHNSVSSFTIDKCRVYNNHTAGINETYGAIWIRAETSSANINGTIKHTTIYSNNSPAIKLTKTDGDIGQLNIYYCLIYHNQSAALQAVTTYTGPLNFYNNTCYHNMLWADTAQEAEVYLDNSGTVNLMNNIIWAGVHASKTLLCIRADRDDVSVSMSNNDLINDDYNNQLRIKSGGSYAYYTVDSYYTTFSDGSNSLNQNPLLTSNYHLSPNSPCIDAGVKIAGIHDQADWQDLAGNMIHYGRAPDIGAYEAITDVATAWGMLRWYGRKYCVRW